tara:strand:- start:905 stop:1861 length:957 start_codon:yes stop_codon:yes gene_type:complete
MNSSALENRIALYDGIRKSASIETDDGVLLNFKLTRLEEQSLRELVQKYILAAAKAWNVSDEIDITNVNYLKDYKAQILNLPNRTPNGAVFPKKENIDEYNELHKLVNQILVSHKIAPHIRGAANPVIRVQDGQDNRYNDRHYATTKLHSDAWVGHTGDAILSIMVDGDQTTGLEFNIPEGQISPSIFSKIENFDIGLEFFEKLRHLGTAKFGHMYIFDHGCIHKTVKSGGGLRTSIEFGIVMNDSKGIASSYNETDNLNDRDTYVIMNQFLRLGNSIKIEAVESLQQTYEKFANEDYNKKPLGSIKTNIIFAEQGEK